MHPSSSKSLFGTRFWRALAFAFPYRAAAIVVLLLTLVLAGLNAIEPLVLRYLFDSLCTRKEFTALWTGLALLVGLGVARELGSSASNWLTWKARIGIHFALLEAMVAQLHRLPLSYHRKEGVGAITTKLDRSIQGFLGALTQILLTALPALLYLVLSVAVMVRLNVPMTLLVLAFAPLPALIAAWATPEQTQRERRLLDQYVRIYSRFNEVLSGIVTVRSFAMEETEKIRFLEEVGRANQMVVRGVGRDSVVGGASNLLVTVARLSAIGLGGWFLVHDQISVGTVFAFLGYVGGLFGPVQGLSGLYQNIQKASVSLEEIFVLLDKEEHLRDRPDARPVEFIRGEVEFDNVHFGYDDSTRPILNGINLRVEPGQTLAIVGPSGSGKSTLTTLLMRFYDPDQGAIRLDGVDLRDFKQSSLRRAIGVVLQDPLLFNDTVRNNIAYGRPEATFEQIVEAAKAANAHDFIAQLPDGYDTVVGERGSRLSVGERQRVTIARALVKSPPLMVLDEATSSLDAESEALVQNAVDRLMQKQTTFVIAHRLATVVKADRIIVLQNGQITETGTHFQLMRANGYYASLVRRQTHGLILNDGEEEAVAVPGRSGPDR